MKQFKILLLLFAFSSYGVTGETSSGDNLLVNKKTEKRNTHFKNIDELVMLRAPGLAYSYLQREQPEYNAKKPAEWLYWEQKRIALLKYMRKWTSIEQRVTRHKEQFLNAKVATRDRNWFLSERLYALVELKQYELALSDTRKLLWGASSLVKSSTLATWRRIIIQIYLRQGMIRDAQVAMRRYQQDYGLLNNEDGVAWLQLQAELLIQLKLYDEAIDKLKKINSSESQTLILLAKLKANKIAPLDALDSAQLVLVSIEDDKARAELFQYVALVASVAAGDIDQSIFLLESLLSSRKINLSDSVLQIGGVKVDADTLWDLYLKKGNAIANQKGLLSGDDESWYGLASNLYQSETVTAKALFAVLSLKSKQLHHRELSMMQLVSLIETNDQSLQLVNRLFTESEKLQNISTVPPQVRYVLVDYSLSQGNVEAAAALMADLKPPQGQPGFDWNLRRARVLILSGAFVRGADVLRDMLKAGVFESAETADDVRDGTEIQAAVSSVSTEDNTSEVAAAKKMMPGDITSQQADKFLQVVFDLQAVGKYRASLDLFNQLQNLTDDVRLQRELTFWKAESYYALEQYSMAAYLFLKSAVSPENTYDPWYHTATFRAAESLLDAGLYEDARQRFLHLLSITQNVARKAVIRQRLQKIQLQQQMKQ